jgi:type III secretory pathway component EscR
MLLAQLERSCQVHRHRKALRCPHRQVDANVVRKASHEELRLLDNVKIARVAQNGVEPLREFLHRRTELKSTEFRKARIPKRWPELEMA